MGGLVYRCVASWKKYCPDYELKLWNEDNYDLSQTPLYVRQAYEAKKYAFVSDYARLDVVCRYGGFYLDTEVDLFRGLDDFLPYRAVFGYLAYNQITTGLGFGSVANSEVVKDMRDNYKKAAFRYPNGEYNMVDCPRYETDYFRTRRYEINNVLSLQNGILFLPSSFLCSLDLAECGNGHRLHSLYALSDNSYALHHCASSWFSSDVFDAFTAKKQSLERINRRLLLDWKRRKRVK
jgi:hypothetical protein